MSRNDKHLTTPDENGVVRDTRGHFAPGSSKPPGSGQRKGVPQRLKRLDAVIVELELRLNRQCDPVVTLVELGAGYDAAAERDLARFAPELVQAVLDTPNWENLFYEELKSLGLRTDVVRALKERVVPRDVRLDASKAAARFVRPMLAQTELSGPDQGPVPVASFNAVDLMGRDKAVAMIEELQIAMAEKVRESLARGAEGDPRADREGEEV